MTTSLKACQAAQTPPKWALLQRQLFDAIEGENPNATSKSRCDIALLLNSVAEGNTPWIGSNGKAAVNLGQRCCIESRTEARQGLQHGRRRVGLHRIVYFCTRRETREASVIVCQDIQVKQEAGGIWPVLF